MNLGDRVKKRRLELGLTQEELAKRMGYSSRVSVNKIEKGRPITQKIVVRLAQALDVKEAYLMGWEEESEDIILDTREKKLIINYRKLDDKTKELIDIIIDKELNDYK